MRVITFPFFLTWPGLSFLLSQAKEALIESVKLEPYLNVSVLSLYSHSKMRLAAVIILHLTQAAGQKKDHNVGDPRGKARAWSGTHCKKGFHRLVPEVGKWYKGQLAGPLHCTVSGRRLPWPWEAGCAGHVDKICMEKEKITSPKPGYRPVPLILVSLLPGQRQLRCSSNPISFSSSWAPGRFYFLSALQSESTTRLDSAP